MTRRIPDSDSKPWYRHFWPWFLMALPAAVVVAGLSTAYIAHEHADDLVVDEYWRRKGVATALYYAARDWGLARKNLRITLELSSKNYPAICFSRKHGFEFTGFNDNYFNNNDIALFFSRLLK